MKTVSLHDFVRHVAAGAFAIFMACETDAALEASVHSEHFDTAKPWTRWWWPGSAVDKESLASQLEKLAAAGIGGVEITPIYGARGYEERYIDFLSPRYMEMLEHAGREAKRLELGVDMATGTGWPFGGPWVGEADALQKLVFQEGTLAGEPARMMVKRAAPGGEGLVVNPYSVDALERYLEPFSKVFAEFPQGLVRGQFHDSFEYYDAAWAPRFPEVFHEMHGYDIRDDAAELMGAVEVDREVLARLKDDFRSTLARMHLDYLREWVRWSHEHGFIVRNQSHGAPGGPALPAAFTTTALKSWTEFGDAAAEAFGGTARYRLEFNLEDPRGFDILDLGDVRESARGKLNGHDIGTIWSLPMRVRAGEFLRRGRNTLELEVTDLAANRIRDMDRRGVDWKIMHEINFVNISYRPFDASQWPVQPSGLLGPVRLLRARSAMTVE
ncbi:MAG: glycosyl hydrolase [Opitutaceae bacterium]